MAHVVGIDLGTTNSLVAAMQGDRPVILPGRGGHRMTPSVVGLDRADRIHVGHSARHQQVVVPDRTVAEVKRLMGSGRAVTLGPRTYSPQEISAFILRALREDAEAELGGPVTEAVITVPAYFTDAQRQATKDAGELAGLRVERIINEPTAAALAYGLDRLDAEEHVLVFDLGGGTLDVSVLEMFSGVLEVKASAGDNHLGGTDVDRLLVEELAAAFMAQHGLDVHGDAAAMARLKLAAEAAKMDLSTTLETDVMLPFLMGHGGQQQSLEARVTRARLEALMAPLLARMMAPVEQALKDARLDRKGVSAVVLVGGATRMPVVAARVAEFFGKAPQRGVHPDEAVALGAAVQAGIKTGTIASDSGIMITDVCPFTLGVEVQTRAGSQRVDGLFSPIIPRNSTVPISRTETFGTTVPQQRQVDIKVFQGESHHTRHNTFLDMYTVDGIPPGPPGSEKVAVTFTYDINGILQVTTRVVSTGREARLTVENASRRMSTAQMDGARARVGADWAGPGSPGAGTRAAGVDAAVEKGARELLATARLRVASAPADQRAPLLATVDALETALTAQDWAAVTRLDAQLTDQLFELG